MCRLILLFAAVLPMAAAGGALAREYVVDGGSSAASDENPGTADLPLATIARAAALARAGDTVIVREGLYREAVPLEHSGEPGAPITFVGQPPGSVVVTGADVITGWERVPGDEPIYRVPWPHQFIINHVDGKPIEHHPYRSSWGDERRWGRAEQVIVDGNQLVPVETLEELRSAWRQSGPTASPAAPAGGARRVPDPADPGTWRGVFSVDTSQQALYLWLADGSDPNGHRVEASTRGLIFGTDPWRKAEGVHDVHVRGFVFRYGATFPQRAAVWLHGHDNLLEDCVVEAMWGSGANVSGTMRRCVVRDCGHTGGGAQGENFLNEDCLWEGNCWKPVNRNWDAGGFKIARSKGGVFRRCVFRRNGGPGLWMDIHVRNVLVTECAFLENEQSGVFIEISRDVHVLHNLAACNGLGSVGKPAYVDWSCGGIQVAESQNCVVAFNTCVGNKDGITLRECGPRPLETEDYGVIAYRLRGNVIVGNVCAANKGYQLGVWYDNGFFGPHPSDRQKFESEEAYEEHLKTVPDEVFDPAEQGMTINRNLYFAEPGQKMILYGTPWRPRHREFDDVAAFARATGFDAHSAAADPLVENAGAGDYRFRPGSPAWRMQVGWLTVPPDLEAWMSAFLPDFR